MIYRNKQGQLRLAKIHKYCDKTYSDGTAFPMGQWKAYVHRMYQIIQ